MSETFWKGEPIETMHRDVLVEILRQQHFRIEALMAALQTIADAPAWGAPDRWETTPSEVRQFARDALEQDK